MDRQTHILTAGATGSGKSVLIKGYINHLLTFRPACQLVLIDPKRIDLLPFRNSPAVIYYGRTEQAKSILTATTYLMQSRYKQIEQGKPPGIFSPVYIVIDELADLLISDKATITPLLRIAMTGRAAGFHLIAATQRPTRELLPMAIKCNFDCRIALRTATAQDSRNICGFPGAEKLPRFGYCLITCPEYLTPEKIPIPNY